MQPKRGRNEIISAVLELCQGEGAIKAKVVHKVKLNFRSVDPYIDALTKSGMLEVLDGPHAVYRTTEKGNETLRLLKEMAAMIS
jgi:predicted transcriptional regulator